MKRLAMVVICAACGEEPKANPPPPGPTIPDTVLISGSVRIHPDAARWLMLTGRDAPPLAGGRITVEEGLKATANQPPLNVGTVDANSDFLFPSVDATQVSLAIFSRLDDPAGSTEDLLMASGTGLQRGRPTTDLSGKIVYGIPRAFARALNDAITDDPVARIPPTLLEREGFILGKVVDASGNGVEGAKLHVFTAATHAERLGVMYFDAQTDGTLRATANTSTSSSGLFLFRPEPAQIKEYTAVRGADVFDKHLAGANAETAYSLTITKQ